MTQYEYVDRAVSLHYVNQWISVG